MVGEIDPQDLRRQCSDYFWDYFEQADYRNADGELLLKDEHLKQLISMASDKVLYEAIQEIHLIEENPIYRKLIEAQIRKNEEG